jgi:hypothetical protein
LFFFFLASLDVIGMLLLSPAFVILIYGIAQVARRGGLNNIGVYAPLVSGVVLMAAYIVYALNTKREPVLSVRLFKFVNFSTSPHASIATRIFQTVGGAFGTAILATVLQRQTAGHAGSDLQAISHAFNAPFWWAIGFTVVAAIPTLFLTMRKRPGPEAAPREADSQAVGSST